MSYVEERERYGTAAAAAKARGISIRCFNRGVAREKARDAKAKKDAAQIVLPKFPRTDEPIEKVIDYLTKKSKRKADRLAAEKWFPIQVRDKLPIGILWFGDPHLGESTKWERLRADVALCATVPGLYAANIGDTTNNWVGSLMRIAAEEDISRKTERRLARWFLTQAGITWLVWLMGNHDEWHDGDEILRLMDVHNRVPMHDWSAKFELVFPNKTRVRIHAAHDVPGFSMWNPTHGPTRAPRMNGHGADLVVAGHRHTWGIQQFEMPDAGKCPVGIRVRGYKQGDHYSKTKGYTEDEHGCGILTIIDPHASPAGRVLNFADTDQGAKVLSALRGGK